MAFIFMNNMFIKIYFIMNKIAVLFLLIFVLSCNVNKEVFNQEIKNDIFPQDWIGLYEGLLDIGARQIPMQLNIDKTDVDTLYKWQIKYGEDDFRDYRLIAPKGETQEFKIDEKNSIILDAFYVKGKLMSEFAVQGNKVMAIYEKKGEELVFEIIFGKEEVDNITGGLDSIPQVNNYKIQGMQRAELVRKK